ncbi:MAG: type VI secretion system tip protein VgrG [Bacteroidetes bacterium]|nr:type VI secretion system tip protein VgrG [Bacteroidota bacterium]
MDDLLIPNPSKHDVVTFSIQVDGQAIDATYQIMSISIMKEVNRIPLARIVVRDGDAAQRKFEVSDSATFIPGKKILINLGFDGTNTQAFKGVITRQSVCIKENGNTQLYVECRDESVKMTLGRHSRYFENKKDSELFDDLIGRYPGLGSDLATTKLTHKQIVQHHVSDWDFLLLRAEANGMLVNVRDGTIKVAPPDTTTSPVVNIAYGYSIIEFEAEMDARDQWKKVEAHSWDYAGQQLFNADTTEASAFTQPGNLSGSDLAGAVSPDSFQMHHSGYLLEQELQDWVDGLMLRSRLAKTRGRVRVTGFPGINPGDMARLDGVGDRWNGNVYVTAVRQDVTAGSWDTQIQFGLDPERYSETYKNIDDRQAAGLIGSVHGLQIGVVVQLGNDPDGEFRILVKVPVIDNNAQGIWTRIASLDAGNSRGAFFMPEIGDEVIIGFINDDPRHAVMLGMLHSSAKSAPITPADANDEKGIITRSQMRVHFNDQTKTITIDTPAGNSIQLDEQGQKIEIVDQNSNKVTMDTSGITVDSPMNVTVKAGADMTISAGASLSISAASVSVKADANLDVEGALAKVAAQGIMEISGSIVKIN